MIIKTAEFVISNTDLKKLPESVMHEYAFIGRSNVGKSSLINMLTNHKKLAKTSSTPGKTRLINHFLINKSWYIVDLPGYGYAKVSKVERAKWQKFINTYINRRKNLINVFLLIDIRHKPIESDLEFINRLGEMEIPFIIVFTKSDKLTFSELEKNISIYKNKLLETWQEHPRMIVTSSMKKVGKDEILDFIEETNKIDNLLLSGTQDQ